MAIRKKLRLSQVGFARRFGFSPRSVQDWDQGRRKPESAARAYLLWSLRFGRKAGVNPWGAVGLEWTISSPPPKDNFHETPVVTWDAYDYPAMLKAMGETQNV